MTARDHVRCLDAVNSMISGGSASGRKRGPLAWSQEYYWFFHHAVPDHLGITVEAVWEIPGTTSTEAVRNALNQLVQRHEALRTIYPLDDDGRPEQVVLDLWPVDLVLAGNGEGAAEINSRLTATAFDPRADQPMRAGLVRQPDDQHQLVLVFNHIAIDRHALLTIHDEFLEVVACGRTVPRPDRNAREPLEQAIFEKTSGGRDSSDEYWRQCLTHMPHTMFPSYHRGRPAQPAAPTRIKQTAFTAAILTCPGLSTAAALVGKRHGTTAPTVFLAAYGMTLAAMSGQDSCTSYVNFTNRIDREVRHSVGCFFRRALVSVEIPPDMSVSELIRRTSAASLRGYRNTRTSFWRTREIMAEVASERGAVLRIGTHFNYTHEPPTGPTDRVPAVSDVNDAVLRCTENAGWDDYDTDVYLKVEPGTEDTLTLVAHKSVCDQTAIKSALRAVARLVVSWATEATATELEISSALDNLDVPATTFGDGWAYIGHSWINTAKLAGLIESIAGVGVADVFSSKGTDGADRLVAYVEQGQSVVTPAILRQQVRGQLTASHDVMVPHWFVVCEARPRTRSEESWSRQRRLAEGDGAEERPERPSSPQEKALWTAVKAFNRSAFCDFLKSYVEIGGEACVTPAVIGELGRRGYCGIGPDDLLGPQPLNATAARLRRR